MGDAGLRSPSPAELTPRRDGAGEGEVTVLVTGFGVRFPHRSFLVRCRAHSIVAHLLHANNAARRLQIG